MIAKRFRRRLDTVWALRHPCRESALTRLPSGYVGGISAAESGQEQPPSLPSGVRAVVCRRRLVGSITSTHGTDVLISSTTDSGSVASPAEHLVEPRSLNGQADLPCRAQDPDLWFSDRPAQLHMAKTFCADCPARSACLAGAIRRREPWGVWGGEIFQQGRIIAQKRTRGRPRKHHIAA